MWVFYGIRHFVPYTLKTHHEDAHLRELKWSACVTMPGARAWEAKRKQNFVTDVFLIRGFGNEYTGIY